MRHQILVRLTLAAAAAGLLMACAGCAASAGTAAGTAVGWTAKGGLFAAKGVTKTAVFAGKVAYGAGKGVHEEFSKPREPAYVEDGERIASAAER
jgi:hypothetical protein